MTKMFPDFSQIGILSLDMVLFESYRPILFTCKDSTGNLYLCVCCQSNAEKTKWLITLTTPRHVIRMLKDEITLRDAFLTSSSKKYTVELVDGQYALLGPESPQWRIDWNGAASEFLPTAGEYMESEECEFDDELHVLENMDKNHSIQIRKTVSYTNVTQYEHGWESILQKTSVPHDPFDYFSLLQSYDCSTLFPVKFKMKSRLALAA